ncbi:MAG: hypothetical protein KatS3mg082_1358 [Nitrospiraceae bacterium]|nr:MAG: hypothetical protein KatS3mg082_1358 [Nitrospiraceae bacterium]
MSFLIALGNLALTELMIWLLARIRRRDQVGLAWHAPASAVIAVTIAWMYGQSVLQADARSPPTPERCPLDWCKPISIKRTNGTFAYREETLERYRRLTAQVADRSDLIIWPEAATPFSF